MREFTKSTLSLPWAMSLFGVEQLANVLSAPSSGKATTAIGAITQATGAQLSELVQALFLLGDTLQRETTDTAFSLLTPEVFNPSSRVTAGLVQRALEIFRSLNPAQDAELTFQELRNKVQVFNLVRKIPETLQLPTAPPYPPLLEVIEKAYAMDPYSTLWAVEGIGHWYGDTFFTRHEEPHGILEEANTRDLPAASMTMMNAGIGMSFAQRWIKTVNHMSPAAHIRHALTQVLALCRNNARAGYVGAALESLGLITRNGQFYNETRPDLMVQRVSQELQDMDETEGFEYFWRGAGRAHFFLPIHFLPGYGSNWHAVGMIRQAVPNHLAWLNAIAGLAWGATMVGIRHPQIVANFVQYHGAELSADDGFSNGVASALMTRQDTTPETNFPTQFYQYQMHSTDPQAVQLWHDLVQQPSTVALQEYYPVLKRSHRLGEVFRYQTFPELLSQVG